MGKRSSSTCKLTQRNPCPKAWTAAVSSEPQWPWCLARQGLQILVGWHSCSLEWSLCKTTATRWKRDHSKEDVSHDQLPLGAFLEEFRDLSSFSQPLSSWKGYSIIEAPWNYLHPLPQNNHTGIISPINGTLHFCTAYLHAPNVSPSFVRNVPIRFYFRDLICLEVT